MQRLVSLIGLMVLMATGAQAQIFDRQFVSADSFETDDGGQRQSALASFVGRHAFAGGALPVGGFFGCNAEGGGECQNQSTVGARSSDDPGAGSSSDDGGSCP